MDDAVHCMFQCEVFLSSSDLRDARTSCSEAGQESKTQESA
jgi:hypothetical protein